MIKIKTELLKSMIDKSLKVCSFDKLSPLTELIEIKIDGEDLSLQTTDKITNMIVKGKIEGNTETARVVVDAKIFAALISKTSTEDVELNITQSSLIVTGNGTYYLDIRIDESGEIISFPEINVDANKETREIALDELSARMAICRPAIPDNFDTPELNNYYLGESIITSNAFVVTSLNNIDKLKDKVIFIRKTLGNILIDLGLKKGKMYIDNDNIIIYDDTYVISSTLSDDLDKYPLEGIKAFLGSKFSYKVEILKDELLALLDRLSLFVSEYDDNSINLLFTKDKMVVNSIKSTANEEITYESAEVEGLVEYSCKVDIKYLKQQMEAIPEAKVTIEFGGSDEAIKFVSGEINQIVSLKVGD